MGIWFSLFLPSRFVLSFIYRPLANKCTREHTKKEDYLWPHLIHYTINSFRKIFHSVSLHLMRFQLELFRFGDFLISFFIEYFRLSVNEFTTFYSCSFVFFCLSLIQWATFFPFVKFHWQRCWGEKLVRSGMSHYLVCHSGQSQNECMLWMFRTCSGVLFIFIDILSFIAMKQIDMCLAIWSKIIYDSKRDIARVCVCSIIYVDIPQNIKPL